MSALEFRRWGAFEDIYGPLGPVRDDHLAALICAQIAATFSNSKTVKVADHMPPWGVFELQERGVDGGDDP